jgi:hypothetical protein
MSTVSHSQKCDVQTDSLMTDNSSTLLESRDSDSDGSLVIDIEPNINLVCYSELLEL